MNHATWTPLHGLSPTRMVTGDLDGNGQDELIVDFGAPYGLYIFANNTSWALLHPLSPEAVTLGRLR